eukprot:366196-Chlamydomonas_euryale.AAC.18
MAAPSMRAFMHGRTCMCARIVPHDHTVHTRKCMYTCVHLHHAQLYRMAVPCMPASSPASAAMACAAGMASCALVVQMASCALVVRMACATRMLRMAYGAYAWPVVQVARPMRMVRRAAWQHPYVDVFKLCEVEQLGDMLLHGDVKQSMVRMPYRRAITLHDRSGLMMVEGRMVEGRMVEGRMGRVCGQLGREEYVDSFEQLWASASLTLDFFGFVSYRVM